METLKQHVGVPDTEIVSVIIPIYNTERYLDRCVRSVTAQTWSALEILLVDDGSTDGSAAMCDRLAEADRRIRVIHEPNGGLSDARNAGIEAATGRRLLFVDSDDFIAPDMVEKLVNAAEEQDAEMSVCNFLHVDEDGHPLPKENRIMPIQDEVLSGEEALARTFDDLGWYFIPACNKLHARELFSSVRFPKGKLHEDEFTAHELLGMCRRIACISDACYFYVQRPGSIVHSRNCRSNLHAAEAYLNRAVYFYDRGMLRFSGRAYLNGAMYLSEAFSDEVISEELAAERKAFLADFRKHLSLRRYCTAKEKLQLSIVAGSPRLYHQLFQNPLRRSLKSSLRRRKSAF
jgi:glycosyltransferase involved in cell wall biosynthesis